MTMPGFDEHEREAFAAKQYGPQQITHQSHLRELSDLPGPDNHLVHGRPPYPGMPIAGFPAASLSAYAAPHAVLFPTPDHFAPNSGFGVTPASEWGNPQMQHSPNTHLAGAYPYSDMHQDRLCDHASLRYEPSQGQQHFYSRSDSTEPQPHLLTPLYPSAHTFQPMPNQQRVGDNMQMEPLENLFSPYCNVQCMQQGASKGASAMCSQQGLPSSARPDGPAHHAPVWLQPSLAGLEALTSTAMQATPHDNCSQAHSSHTSFTHVQVIATLHQGLHMC